MQVENVTNIIARNETYLNSSYGTFGRHMPWIGSPGDPDIPRATFLVVCICVSTIGNGAVMYISILRLKKASFFRLNLLIFSLALSDFLQAFTLLIPQLLKRIYGEWVIGLMVCKFHTSLRFMQVNISICTLALVTLERFIYLDKMPQTSENKPVYIAIIVVVWIVQMALAVPMGVWTTVVYTPKKCTIPYNVFANKTEEYVIIAVTLCFFVPLLIMWIGNIGIIYKMRKSSIMVRPLQTNPRDSVLTSNRKDKERRTTLTCLMLALVFTVTLVPFQTCLFMFRAGSAQHLRRVMTIMSYVWPLTILNPCINPFIYSVFIKEIRQKVKEMMICTQCLHIPKSCCKQEKENNTGSASNSGRPLAANIVNLPGGIPRNVYKRSHGSSEEVSPRHTKVTSLSTKTNPIKINGKREHAAVTITNKHVDVTKIVVKKIINARNVAREKSSSYADTVEISSEEFSKSSESSSRNPYSVPLAMTAPAFSVGGCSLSESADNESVKPNTPISLPKNKPYSLLHMSKNVASSSKK